ncbi:MAG: hypothetical protein P8I91_08710 [Phycisphaerales bacterium]|nr:hypothetical protein [Phycisphaerales bacterium]
MTPMPHQSGRMSSPACNGTSPIARLLAVLSPGWPFLLGGVLVVGAAMLLPAWRDVQSVRFERDQLAAQVDTASQRLAATYSIRESLRRDDAELKQRLIAWQHNRLPVGDIALAREIYTAGVLGWIDSTVPAVAEVAIPPVPTRLERLVSGPSRLWMLGAGVLMVFVGLVGFGASRSEDEPLSGDVCLQGPSSMTASSTSPRKRAASV